MGLMMRRYALFAVKTIGRRFFSVCRLLFSVSKQAYERWPPACMRACEWSAPRAISSVSSAHTAITAAIEPGGSIRDEEVIKAADENNMAMVFTSVRHFRH